MEESRLYCSLFYASLAISLLAITLGAMSFARDATVARSATLDWLVTRFPLLDPQFLVLATALLAIGVWLNRIETRPEKRFRLLRRAGWLLLGVAVAAALAAFEYFVVERLALKPALGYLRPDPAGRLPDGLVTQWTAEVLSRILPGGVTVSEEGAPSGFVLRQTLASLILLSFLWGRRKPQCHGLGWSGPLLGLFSVAALGWTMFSRVYSGMHFLVDCTLALAVGVNLFWIIALFANCGYLAARRCRGTEWRLLVEQARTLWPFSLVTMLVLFLMSGDSYIWAFLLPAALSVVSLVFLIALRRTQREVC